MIQKILESNILYLKDDLPSLIQKLGLCVPAHLSSLCRFVMHHTEKAFRKEHFSESSMIPALLQPKASFIGPLCEDAGLSENWLFNSEKVYVGQATITLGLLLELRAVKKARRVSDSQCSVWVQLANSPSSCCHSEAVGKDYCPCFKNSGGRKRRETIICFDLICHLLNL